MKTYFSAARSAAVNLVHSILTAAGLCARIISHPAGSNAKSNRRSPIGGEGIKTLLTSKLQIYKNLDLWLRVNPVICLPASLARSGMVVGALKQLTRSAIDRCNLVSTDFPVTFARAAGSVRAAKSAL